MAAGTLDLSNSAALQNSTLSLDGAGKGVVFDQSVLSNSFILGGLSSVGATTAENINLVNNARCAHCADGR